MDWPKRLFRKRTARFGAVASVVLVALAVGALNGFATIAPSTFDAGDGNLVLADTDGAGGPDTADLKDWANVGIDCTSTPKVGCGLDLQRSTLDDSFGGGTSENDAVPKITDGSIPNNKSDLIRYYSAGETVNNNVFIYLGWERVQEPNGTTNMDFELNQNRCKTPDLTDVELCSANGVTPQRKAGDVLVRYDLSQGGTTVALGFHKWVTSGPCEAGNKLPCWSPEQSLGNNGEASINNVSVTDPINPGAPRSLDARTFGEASINLTGAGLVDEDECLPFASAYLKSRSSDSFTSEIKDFVQPVQLNLNTCGNAKVIKQDDAGNKLGGVKFELFKNVDDNDQVAEPEYDNGVDNVAANKVGECTTGDGNNNTTLGECSIANVPPGDYWFVEDTSTVPSGHGPANPTHQLVQVTAGQTVTKTFTNPRLHKVIVLVCHEGANPSLVASDVTNGTSTKTTLGTPPGSLTQAQLCGANGLAGSGATFGGKGHLTEDDYKVDIGQMGGDPHP